MYLLFFNTGCVSASNNDDERSNHAVAFNESDSGKDIHLFIMLSYVCVSWRMYLFSDSNNHHRSQAGGPELAINLHDLGLINTGGGGGKCMLSPILVNVFQYYVVLSCMISVFVFSWSKKA